MCLIYVFTDCMMCCRVCRHRTSIMSGGGVWWGGVWCGGSAVRLERRGDALSVLSMGKMSVRCTLYE